MNENQLVDESETLVGNLPTKLNSDAWRLTLEYIELGRLIGICSGRPLIETYREMCERYPLLYKETGNN